MLFIFNNKTSFSLILSLLLLSCGSQKKTQQVVVIKDPQYIEPIEPVVEKEEKEKDTYKINFDGQVPDIDTAGLRKDLRWAGSMHYDNRKPNFVIIHHTAQHSVDQTIRTFNLPHTKVSAHYLIGKDGEVFQLLNDYIRAWHAGVSKWGNITDMNSASLGIELDNNGSEPFPDTQIDALLDLLDTLQSHYDIPQPNFLGHADVAPARKNDPNVLFPWKKLYERGFGLWYDEDYLRPPPEYFNPLEALRLIGYDISNPKAAIKAFKRKFIQTEVDEELSPYDITVIYNLYTRYF